MKYLYGASVQGIQEFVFQTNKLKEIVGASQLVDYICTSEFRDFCAKQRHTVDEKNIIISAAGNIKYLLSKDDCEMIVRFFPKHISNYAPGITISQATVKLTGNLKNDIDELEHKLKAQRNKAEMPVDNGFMGLERARRTAGVAHTFDKDKKHIDRATFKKREMFEKHPIELFKKFKESIKTNRAAFDMKHITGQNDNSWLAIIHADGNALGLKLQNIAKKINDNKKVKEALSLFSKNLELAIQEAVQETFEKIIDLERQKKIEDLNQRYPLRPIVLGGDDLTVIIRADLAFDFTKEYLKAFEEKTKVYFEFMKTDYDVEDINKGLTACAGIAYIKETYPFHYGVHLAESLCAEAKKFSKKIDPIDVPSSLSFYKVQASYIDDLETMKARTHYSKASKISFDYGPYLISKGNNGESCIKELDDKIGSLEKLQNTDSKGISKLRQWLSELHRDESKAEFMMNRMKTVNKNLYEKLNLYEAIKHKKTILQDIIHLHTFKTQTDED